MIQVNKSIFYSVQEVADKLHISKSTVLKLLKQRKLHSVKVGRNRYIDAEVIESFLKM